VITLGVEILLNKEAINKKVDEFLRGGPLDFLTAKKFKVPADMDLKGLERLRRGLVETNGANSLAVKGLDIYIRKLKEAQAAQKKAGIGMTPGPGAAIGAHRTRTTSSLGTETPVVENHITVRLDSEVLSRSVTKSQQKTRRRNPPQKRGPNTGH
jgi:hypothetical protein